MNLKKHIRPGFLPACLLGLAVSITAFSVVMMLDHPDAVPYVKRERPVIEFYGDSITAGGHVNCAQTIPECEDSTKSFAYLVAQELHADGINHGRGGEGLFLHYSDAMPQNVHFKWARGTTAKEHFEASHSDTAPDAVVIEEGTNDTGARAVWLWGVRFAPAYWSYVRAVRKTYPQAKIFCLAPLNRAHREDIQEALDWLDAQGPPTVDGESSVGKGKDTKIFYVETAGWLGPEDFTDTLHPNASGQKILARHLAAVLRYELQGTPVAPGEGRTGKNLTP